jgi:hypothetical protein
VDPNAAEVSDASITALVHRRGCETCAILLSDGSAALCLTDGFETASAGSIEVSSWLLGPGDGAVCGAISAQAQMVAVGCTDGVLRLWGCASDLAQGPQRQLSLVDWGHGPEATGRVACVAWTQDGQVRA